MKNRWKQNPIIWKKQNFDSIKKTNPGKESIMERRSMWSRLLAIVLAVSMVFSSQSMSVFADTLAIIQQPQDTNEKKNQPADDTSKDNQETSEESEEETTAAEESSETQREQTVQMTGTINGENVNLRSEPSTSSEVLSKAQTGDVVSILGEVTGDDGNTWYEILYGQGSAFVSAEFVTVEETAEEESEEETTNEVVEEEAEKNELMLMSDGDSDDGTITANNENLTVKEFAEKYYGQASPDRVNSAVFVIEPVAAGTEIEAGATKQYRIRYTIRPAEEYNYLNQSRPLFDTYENVTLTLKLPDNLTLVTSDTSGIPVSPGENNTWTFSLGSFDASRSSSGAFTFNVEAPNGVLNVGTVLDWQTQGGLTYNAEFTVLDKTNSNNPIEVTDAPSSQTLTTADMADENISPKGMPSNLTVVSDDEWVIDKEYIDQSQDNEKGTVTVRFRLKVGLEATDVVDGETISYAISDPGAYNEDGRAPITNGQVTLNDQFSLTGWSGQLIDPTSITIRQDFGEKLVLTENYTEGEDISVLLNTCGNAATELNNVADTAPYYSEYIVTAVYKKDDLTGKFYQQTSNKETLTLTNDVSMTYQIGGAAAPQTDTAQATAEVGEIEHPAELNIEKLIEDWKDGTTTPYSSSGNWDRDVSGAAVFEVYAGGSESETLAVLYTKNQDGTYTQLTGEARKNKLSINGTQAEEDGSITDLYVEAGEYTIKEIQKPVNTGNSDPQTITVAANEEETIPFTNKEELGGIEITKVGVQNGATTPLAGVTFDLYTQDPSSVAEGDSLTPLMTSAATNAEGKTSFEGLVPGTYYVVEKEAPEGYTPDDRVVAVTVIKNQTITASTEGYTEGENSLTFINNRNTSHVRLQKQYIPYGSMEKEDIGNNYYQEFDKAFTLQSKSGTSGWNDIKTGLSLGSNGTINEELPVYDGDGNPITYRFVETLPEGWHDENGEGTVGSTVNSEEFTLEQHAGNSSTAPYTVYMVNRRNGSISLTKRFVNVNAQNGTKGNASSGSATFELYRRLKGSEAPDKYGENSYLVNANGTNTVRDLPVADSTGVAYEYFWKEVSATEGYKLEGTTSAPITTIKGVEYIGPFCFVSGEGESQTVDLSLSGEVKNVQQKVSLVVRKKNAYTNQYISGASITIEQVIEGGNRKIVENEAVPGNENGYSTLLDPGYKYLIYETTTPDNYIGIGAPIEVDYTDVKVGDISSTANVDLEHRTVDIDNTPLPKLTVTKERINANGTSNTTLRGVEFEVYTKDGDTFVPYNTDGSSTEAMKILSGTQYSLPAGTYYLKEIVDAKNTNEVLDPSTFPSLYEGQGEMSDGSFYFGSIELKQDRDDYIEEYTIENYSNKGSLTVTKVDEKGALLGGVEIQVYSEEKQESGTTGTTGDDLGKITFTGLPIYNENGEPITYEFREVKCPDRYYVIQSELDALKTELLPGETVSTVVNDGAATDKPLTIVNYPYHTFTVTKQFEDVWEYTFTQKRHLVEGAEIALYKLNETTNMYEVVRDESGAPVIETTSSAGVVSFYPIQTEGTYAAVEVSAPQFNGQNMEPENGDYIDPEVTTSFPANALEGDAPLYNAVIGSETAGWNGQLLNLNNWTQLHIFKYKNDDITNQEEKEPQDGAVFELYRQIITDTSNKVLAFNRNDCDLIGTYTSGTLTDENGVRQEGELATDILDCGDNIVYWLVETESGPGAEIDPTQQYILFQREGQTYTNNTPVSTEDGTTFYSTVAQNYPDNAVGSYEVRNERVTGNGILYRATIKLSKWAGKLDGNGDHIEDPTDKAYGTDGFDPLGGTQYELWLVNENGDLLVKLDDLTLGLETDQSPTVTTVLSAIAQSDILYANELEALYGDLADPANIDDVLWAVDAEGNPIKGIDNVPTTTEDPDAEKVDHYRVRLAIRESYVPYGYQQDAEAYYLIADLTRNGIKENEQYFVKDGVTKATFAQDAEKEWAESGDHYRLMNWPIDNYSVTVSKYGYTPVDGSTLGLTAAELDAYYESGNTGRTALGGVTMLLEKYNTNLDADGHTIGWQPYDYENLKWVSNNTTTTADESENPALFTTETSGRFYFPKGLDIGLYRITEVDLGTNAGSYEMLYDRSGTSTSNRTGGKARYFSVSNQNVMVSMYNPTKVNVTLTKTGMDGSTLLADTTFTLHSKNSATTYSPTTTSAGIATFTNVTSGTYWLSEDSTPSNYTNSYFEEFLEDAGWGALLENGEGVYLGYDTAEKNGDTVVSAIHRLERTTGSEGEETSESLTVRNPQKVSLTIQKQDNYGNSLEGAEFAVYYQAFDKFSGEVTVDDATLGKSNPLTLATNTTNAQGQLVLTGLEPGIYYIEETNAPEDYEKVTEGVTVAITGGMGITIGGSAADSVITATNDTATVTSNSATVTFINKRYVDLTVTKNFASGESGYEYGDYRIPFSLYTKSENTEGTEDVYSLVSQKTASKNSSNTTDAVFNDLSQGTTYYLKEDIPDNADYVLLSVYRQTSGDNEDNRVKIEADENGYYPIQITDDTDITVTVTNRPLYAKVTIRKVDGSNGDGLPGAEFVVKDAAGKTVVTENEWSEGVNQDEGLYTAFIPLTSADGEDFTIEETVAPEPNYVLSEDVLTIEDLKPGEAITAGSWNEDWEKNPEKSKEAILSAYILPNYQGTTIELTKYDSVYSDTGKEPLAGVTFSVYYWSGTEEDGSWRSYDSADTDEQGKVRFVVSSGQKYALSETLPNTGYDSLEGIWEADVEPSNENKLQMESQDNLQLYVLEDGADLAENTTYSYVAYNVPQVNLQVRKSDASGSNLIPKALVSVYEVSEGTPETLSEEQIRELAVEEKRVGTQVSTSNVNNAGKYSYTNNIPVAAGKTYLVVEDAVTGTDGYNTMILDDNRVVWYQVVKVSAEPADRQKENPVVVELKNVLGHVGIATAKNTTTESLPSLLDQNTTDAERTVTYTLSADAQGNTYGLDSFELLDDGLTARSNGNELTFADYLYEKYSITSVTVGNASHDVSMYGLTSAPIKARVTFIDFNGEETPLESVYDVAADGEPTVVDAPDSTKKYAKVRISYYAPDLEDAENVDYSLGQNFQVSNVQVTVVLDQQTEGQAVQAIDEVVNESVATLTYRTWSSTGEQVDKETEIDAVGKLSISDDSDSSVTIGTLEAPQVTIEKSADAGITPIGGTQTYYVTIANETENNTDLSMTDPVIVDLIPRGTVVERSDVQIVSGDGFGANTSGLTLNPRAVQVMGSGEDNAVLIPLSGALKPGDSVTVQIDIDVTEAVVRYGTSMANYAFLTSSVSYKETSANPTGASFQDESGNWPFSLENSEQFSGIGDRITALRSMLGEAYGDNGFIHDSVSSTWSTTSEMTLVKEQKGSNDSAYSANTLSYVETSTEEKPQGVDYRLTINNVAVTDRTNLVVMDIIPHDGDGRGSQWDLVFDRIDSATIVKADGSSGGDASYIPYYYTGENVSGLSSQIMGAQDWENGTLPDGWVASVDDLSTVKAFVLQFTEDVILEDGDSLVVNYSTKVPEYDALELADIAYTNTVNHFYAYYDDISPEDSNITTPGLSELVSNRVSVTIGPNRVNVGGVVWIDKNEDGQRQNDETIDNFQNHELVQDLLEGITIGLTSYTTTDSGRNVDGTTVNYSKDSKWMTTANYVFTNLIPGLMTTTDLSQAYGAGGDKLSNLNVSLLKGDNPSTYMLTASWPANISKFSLTTVNGSGHSQQPGEIPAEEQTDNNFDATGSERFYLWPSSTDPSVPFDNTKDIGFVLHRDLEITKVASDNSNVKVEGATFKIYGPYEEGEAANATLSDDKLVKNVISTDEEGNITESSDVFTTDADGKITVPDLRWFGEYVIVEVSAAEGTDYVMTRATASGVSSRPGKTNEWVLEIPDEKSTSSTSSVTVKNVRETEVTLQAVKKLSGMELGDKEFTFELYDTADFTKDPLQTVTNNGESVTFNPITITSPTTTPKIYYIRESQAPRTDGIVNDDTVYRAEITASWNTETQKFKTSVTYYNNADSSDNGSAKPTFTNTYSPTDSWAPTGTKILTGRDMAEGEEYTFNVYELMTKDTADGTVTERTLVSTATVTGAKNGVETDLEFEEIDYDLNKLGSHTYEIREEVPEADRLPGVEYDISYYHVTVTVSDNDKTDAGLEITVSDYTKYKNDEVVGEELAQADFENDYQPVPDSYNPQVTKSIELVSGEPIPADKEFRFTLTPDENNPEGGAVLPGGASFLTATITVEEGQTSAAAVGFGDITFTKEGDYSFTITENDVTGTGYSKDSTPWTLKVSVTEENYRLNADASYWIGEIEYSEATSAAFTNRYEPTPAEAAPTVKKTVEGDVPEGDQERTFTFELAADSRNPSGGATLPEETTLTLKADEVKTFGNIRFTKSGTYVFNITETPKVSEEEAPGYTYDSRTWTWTVKVEDTNDDGQLDIVPETYRYSCSDDTSNDELAEFKNIYQPTVTSYQPKVNKVMDGAAVPEGRGKEFTFELKAVRTYTADQVTIPDADGQPMAFPADGITVSHIGSGDVSFTNMTFKKAGTYQFTIKEADFTDDGTYNGYTKDGSEWTLTIEVNDTKGVLSTDVEYQRTESGLPEGVEDSAQSPNADKAVFINKYEVSSDSYAPVLRKTVSEAPVPSGQEKTFTFTLAADADNPEGASLPNPATLITGETERAQFGAIQFTAAGTYTFTITENDLSEEEYPGYTKDSSVWTVTVPVTDIGGELEVQEDQITYRKGDTVLPGNDAIASFDNTYETISTTYTPKVSKTLTGAKIPAGKTFTFELETYSEDPAAGAALGATTAQVTYDQNYEGGENAQAREASFGEITFTKAGTYVYLIRETSESGNGYTCDSSTWKLTVTVTDIAHKLQASGVYVKLDQEDQEIEDTESTTSASFENSYSVQSVDYIPGVDKTFADNGHDRPDKEKTFTFTITPKSQPGASISENKAVVTDDRDAKFGTITFTEAGRYTFTITEDDLPAENGEINYNGYSKDPSVWTLTVEIVDQGGRLAVAENGVQYTKNGSTATNTTAAVFENTYLPDSTTYQPTAKKTITGNIPEGGATFDFTLTDSNAAGTTGYTMPDDREASVSIPAGRYDGTEPAMDLNDPFGSIQFTKAGTYNFQITERDAGEPGYTYDSAWTLTVTVIDTNGELSAVPSYTRGSEESSEYATFRNQYQPGTTSYQPKVDKTLTGTIPEEATFNFTLTDANAPGTTGYTMPENTEASVTFGAGIYSDTQSQGASFESITFSEAGTYTFQIEETTEDKAGFAYDGTIWTLTVTVTDNNGSLTRTVEYTAEGKDTQTGENAAAEFANSYTIQKEADYRPVVAKHVDGEVPEGQEQEFTFTLNFAEGTQQVGATLPEDTTLTTGETEEAKFGNIHFTAAGTYTFTIKEEEVTYPGYGDYDTSTWELTVVVVDVNAELQVQSVSYRKEGTTDSADKATFENKYEITKNAEFAPEVSKSLTGVAIPTEKTFTFKLSGMPNNPSGAQLPGDEPTAEVTFPAGEHADIRKDVFDPITFTKAGTYQFKVEETGAAGNGYHNDTRYWVVTVEVTDTASELNAELVSYEQFNADGSKVTLEEAATSALFENSYSVTSTKYVPKVEKRFSSDSDVRPSDNEKTFTFTMQASPSNPQGASLNGEDVLTTSVVGDNESTFTAIEFTRAGDYQFTIVENPVNIAGYEQYDTRTWTLKVTVVDEGGALKVDEKKTGYFIENTEISRTDFAEFENEYHVTSTTYEPTVNKEFTADSDERPEENQKTFTFAIRQTAGDLAGVNITNHICTVTGEGSGTFGEGAIEFTKAGIYTFEIKEQPLTEGMYDGYTADPDPWTLTVEVEDRESKLTVSSVEYVKGSEKSEEEATFTNEYHLTETAEAPLGVEKVMTGDLQRDVNFTFHMSAEETEGIVMPTDTTAVITIPEGEYEEETFTTEFEEIEFTKAGEYHFTITEQDDKAAGYSYDSSVWTAIVKVVDKESVLEVESISYSKQTTVEGEPATVTDEQAVFTNSYSTVETSYAPRVEKVLSGSERPDEKEFRFTLTAFENNEDGASLEAGSSMETAVTGERFATFETITFTKAGTYQFTIRENEVTLPGYADYDTSEWTLTVEVEDVDHILTESHSYTRTAGGEDLTQDEEATFDNNYSVTPDTYQPRVTKEVTGTPAVNEEFHFTISAAEEYASVLLPEETEVTIEGNGEAEFGEITFQAAGTYYFNIVETAGESSYTYDESQWTLVVTVEDHDSVLEATAVYQRNGETVEGAEAAAFENHYHASGEVLLNNFTKTLNGSPLAAGQFTFELADADGNVLQTVTNATDGSIPFEALTYDESDIGQEYTYTVSEVNNNVTGVAYDTTIYTVIVAVADSENSDGTLDITTTILNGEETIEGEEGALPQITFTNTFGGTVTLTKQNDSQQVLAGAEFRLYARTEGADTYEVYASEGNAEGRYTTDVNGQIQITDLPANDYYFVETRAPQGYVIETDEAGQPLHYDFTIGVQDGVAGIAENAVVNAALTVTNDGATTGSIQVTKRVGRIGDNFDIVDLIAVNETYYVGLFLDAAGTQPYGTDNVKAIQMNGVSVSEAVTFDNLPSGTYYVLETDAQGNPIVMNETQTTADGGSYYCTLEEGQNNQVTVDLTVSEEPGTVMLTNVYLEFSEDYYWDATIDITKRVLRNGEEATADDTFYAGVYQMLEDGSYELLTEVELQQNDTVTVTGLGGPIGESMTYYVFETDGNGNRVSEDPAFRYAVSGEGSVTVTQDSTAGSITITNEYEEEEPTEEPSEKPTEKPSEKPTEPTTKSTDAKDTEPTTTTSTKATKTGDTTDLTVELLLMAVAAVLMGTSVYARKRRRNRR